MKRIGNFAKILTILPRKHPRIVQTFGTGALMATGDVIAQTIAEHHEDNFKRTVTYFSVGCILGPILGGWYKVLDRIFGKKGGVDVVIKKIAVDQLFFAPISLLIVVSSLDSARGREIKQIKEDLRTKYFDILKSNYEVWPAVQFMNFYFVPLHYRVLFVQSVAVMWNAYLSWKIK